MVLFVAGSLPHKLYGGQPTACQEPIPNVEPEEDGAKSSV